MQRIRLFTFSILAGFLLAAAPPSRAVQVSFSVNIGPAPICPYGYFPYHPYHCAPFGYYGPAWFPNGVFIGAGPWFHGPRDFHGWVNRRFDPRYGYHGRLPRRGHRPPRHRLYKRNFRGNAQYDGHGRSWSRPGKQRHPSRNQDRRDHKKGHGRDHRRNH